MNRFLVLTTVGTVVGFLIGGRGPLGGFWAPRPDAPQAHGAVLAGFIAENLVENIAFGGGLAILLMGRRWFAERVTPAPRATIAWLSATWLLASWMPHSTLHLHLGVQPAALLPIEWVFHAGAIIAAAALLWSTLTANDPARPPLAASTDTTSPGIHP